MITWKLWSALFHPPADHPVFQRFAAPQAASGHKRIPILIIAVALVFYFGYQIMLFQAPVRLLFGFSSLEFVAALVTFDLAYGVVLTAMISVAIARTRESGMYESLCLTPSGAPGVNWAICTGTLYRRPGLEWFRFGLTLLSLVLFIALTIHFVVTLLLLSDSPNTSPQTRVYAQMLVDLTEAYTLVATFYLGAIQTIVTAVLVGMIAATALNSTSMARPWSVGVFLLLQIMSLLVALLVSSLLPSIYPFFGLSGLLTDLSLPVLRLAFFVAIREVLNAALWQTLLHQLNGEWRLSTAWAAGQV